MRYGSSRPVALEAIPTGFLTGYGVINKLPNSARYHLGTRFN
jgi:hypothetical protein